MWLIKSYKVLVNIVLLALTFLYILKDRTGNFVKDMKVLDKADHHQENKGEVVRRKVVFIIGAGRSGTSLLGEFFNTNDEFFYLFEPLKSVRTYFRLHRREGEKYLLAREQIQLLRDIIDCKYRPRNDKYLALLHNNGVFVHKMKFLQEPPFCMTKVSPNQNNTSNCSKPLINSIRMNQVCRSLGTSKTVVLKDLYYSFPYSDPSLLKYLDYPRQRKFYVLHALRDPRAVLLSHRALGWIRPNATDVIVDLKSGIPIACSMMDRILKTFQTKGGKNTIHYTIFRYEDVALKPLGLMAGSLAKFLDVDLKNEFHRYLKIKTRANKDVKKTHSLTLAPRNMKKAVLKWRKEIYPSLLSAIESVDVCKQVITALGFQLAFDIKKVRNTSIPLIFNPKIKDVLGN